MRSAKGQEKLVGRITARASVGVAEDQTVALDGFFALHERPRSVWFVGKLADVIAKPLFV
jgi:hypothetical protein